MWRPIATDQQKERISEVVAAVIEDCDRHFVDKRDVGVPLLHLYAARCGHSSSSLAVARQRLGESIEALPSAIIPSLFGGYLGVAWLSAHFDRVLGGEEVGAYEEVDDHVEAILKSLVPPASYDLITGLVGIGVYLLERQKSKRVVQLLGLLCGAVEELAHRDGRGACWHTSPGLLPPHQRVAAPTGYYNVGLAHGIGGVIGVLGRAVTSAPSEMRDSVVTLLREACAWAVAVRQADGAYPSWIADGQPQPGSRIAWCYGELGLNAVLSAAADELQSRELAMDTGTALRGTALKRSTAATPDAGLCHGAAGNSHVFNRIYQATGDTTQLDAAQFWLQLALDMRGTGGIGGYRSWRADAPTFEPKWLNDSSFLTGASGIALALLAAGSPVEPTWDSLLVLSHV